MPHEVFSDYLWQKAGNSRHTHVHAMVADGLFTETGYFYVMPKVAIRSLGELFRASVLKILKNEGLLDDALIKKSVHPFGFIAGITQHIPERLAQMVRDYG